MNSCKENAFLSLGIIPSFAHVGTLILKCILEIAAKMHITHTLSYTPKVVRARAFQIQTCLKFIIYHFLDLVSCRFLNL